jgi:hypothetical protein
MLDPPGSVSSWCAWMCYGPPVPETICLWFDVRRCSACVLLCASLLGACSSDPPAMACGVSGRERSCPCSGNAVGIQVCQLNGQWDACTCYPLEGGALPNNVPASESASDAAGTSPSSSAGGTGDRAGSAAGSAGAGGAGGRMSRFPFPFGGGR